MHGSTLFAQGKHMKRRESSPFPARPVGNIVQHRVRKTVRQEIIQEVPQVCVSWRECRVSQPSGDTWHTGGNRPQGSFRPIEAQQVLHERCSLPLLIIPGETSISETSPPPSHAPRQGTGVRWLETVGLVPRHADDETVHDGKEGKGSPE